MTDTARADLLIGDLLSRLHAAIAEHDVSYEEFQAAKAWLIAVGEAGEWPLFLDVFVEHAVERQAFGNRRGSQGTILGPYHLPGAPVLQAPFELPRRPDEEGEPVLFDGRVTGEDGVPLAGAELDVWHADAKGLYSGFDPSLPAGILRGKVLTDGDGRFEVRTIVPAPYTIPEDGPTGAMVHAAGWSPWRPAHIHVIVSAEGHEPLVTQLYIDSSAYLDSDVASAVKDELIVHPRPREGGDGLGFTYDFALAKELAAAAA
jgi:catechol 1,2-dioxygenase